ncbi:MAG: DEAD/DEAH box helicase family protein [Paludibacteraceae bacterium]|nr:DEAD/DEAH box helicase family protein [Paludibacteraceae bacterium]
MAKYGINEKVLHASTRKHGRVIEVAPLRRGRQLYRVLWENGIENDEMESDLRPDFDISNPFDRVGQSIYDSYNAFAERNTTFKIQNSNNSTVSSLKAARTLFRAYQFKPLLKFLNSVNRRLLVADEVGLGKTIEAGHIMLELKARNQLKNVLIVCPLSLQAKWQTELKDKFGLIFDIYEDKSRLVQDFENRNGTVKAIINYEKIQLRNVQGDQDEDRPRRVNEFIDSLIEKGYRISLTVCDEAHKMRNSETQTYRGAERLMDCTDAALFLTATPVMISTENLYNLLHLLDNAKYYNYQIFDNLLEENKPFVKALSDVNSGVALPKIAKQLADSIITTRYWDADGQVVLSSETKTVQERFYQYPIYQRIMDSLLNCEDTHALRAQLQQHISSMSVMNNIFSRTRKVQVIADLSQAVRHPYPCIVQLTDDEQKEYDNVIEEYVDDNSYTNWYGQEVLPWGARLGLVQKKRQIASSVYAYLNADEDLENGIDVYADSPDAKINYLDKIIKEVFADGRKKLIIFALFRKTLNYLRIRLSKLGYTCAMIHGGIQNRELVLEAFEHNDNIQILLSSEVGSEGLDMQFCNSMVNYDLPWNPMVVEQRIGRIDRFGQQSPIVHIYNFIVAGSIQEDIYTRLLDRIGVFRSTVGGMEAILDAKIEEDGREGKSVQQLYENLEKELYYNKLTPEQREKKILQVEQAIENNLADLRNLEEGLSSALTNDAYFKDEIQRLLRQNAYVTESELYNYIYMVLQKKLTTCQLVDLGDYVFEFRISPSEEKALSNFMAGYRLDGDEMEIAYRAFLRQIDGKTSFLLTFHQEKAFQDKSLIYINLYHPLIQICLKYYAQYSEKNACTFKYALPAGEHLFAGQSFFLALYRLSTIRKVQGIPVVNETLHPIAFDIANDCIAEEAISNSLLSLSQTKGLQTYFECNNVDNQLLKDMRVDLKECIDEKKAVMHDELEVQILNDKMRDLAQLQEWHRSRTSATQKKIEEYEKMLHYLEAESNAELRKSYNRSIAGLKGQLTRLDDEKTKREAIINEDPELRIEETLVALNYIRIC